MNKELENLSDKLERTERENQQLRKHYDGLKNKCCEMERDNGEMARVIEGMREEKMIADNVTEELLARVQRYEEQISELERQLTMTPVTDSQGNDQQLQELREHLE